MELHYLKIFHTVAKYTSFKKASEVLCVSQPALSIQIKKLESQAGLKLFNKIGNRIVLSEDGEMLYRYTQKIFAIVEELENHVQNLGNEIAGTINLGASNTPGVYILPKVIGEMKKRYPGVTVNLHVADTSEIANLIENGTLDVAVNGGNGNYNSNIFTEKLFNDRLVIVASPENPLAAKDSLDIQELSDTAFVVHSTTSQLYTYYKKFIEAYGLTENIGMHFGSIDAIKYAIYADLGVSILPFYAVKSEIEKGMLTELRINCDKLEYPYSLIYNKNKHLSITNRKFIEILKEVL
ncbi:LysR family transcriptional regulator [Anaerocolumna xylanovorans]|uniref:DNA-binding transcriptional regulator, LysR family n=1 Tax=Anaerocolumna xylanovorans DSM 12503 TaxID=1121345 RepID=A0A1M7XX37_9FIRM|nr:LysR family transcriptional regulator [Anaerocolumna xylanovorans]SHO43415.1 DNA-binding transcriptional regulator, LysR family [Anaerocolumna xylanovorans DSM 12503]